MNRESYSRYSPYNSSTSSQHQHHQYHQYNAVVSSVNSNNYGQNNNTNNNTTTQQQHDLFYARPHQQQRQNSSRYEYQPQSQQHYTPSTITSNRPYISAPPVLEPPGPLPPPLPHTYPQSTMKWSYLQQQEDTYSSSRYPPLNLSAGAKAFSMDSLLAREFKPPTYLTYHNNNNNMKHSNFAGRYTYHKQSSSTNKRRKTETKYNNSTSQNTNTTRSRGSRYARNGGVGDDDDQDDEEGDSEGSSSGADKSVDKVTLYSSRKRRSRKSPDRFKPGTTQLQQASAGINNNTEQTSKPKRKPPTERRDPNESNFHPSLLHHHDGYKAIITGNGTLEPRQPRRSEHASIQRPSTSSDAQGEKRPYVFDPEKAAEVPKMEPIKLEFPVPIVTPDSTVSSGDIDKLVTRVVKDAKVELRSRQVVKSSWTDSQVEGFINGIRKFGRAFGFVARYTRPKEKRGTGGGGDDEDSQLNNDAQSQGDEKSEDSRDEPKSRLSDGKLSDGSDIDIATSTKKHDGMQGIEADKDTKTEPVDEIEIKMENTEIAESNTPTAPVNMENLIRSISTESDKDTVKREGSAVNPVDSLSLPIVKKEKSSSLSPSDGKADQSKISTSPRPSNIPKKPEAKSVRDVVEYYYMFKHELPKVSKKAIQQQRKNRSREVNRIREEKRRVEGNTRKRRYSVDYNEEDEDDEDDGEEEESI